MRQRLTLIQGTALQAVVRVNGLSSTLTASSLSDPSWSVVECVTDDGAVEEKIFWLPLVMDMDGSATAEDSVRTLLVYPNALKLQHFRNRHRECSVAPTDGQQVECTILLGCGGCDRMAL